MVACSNRMGRGKAVLFISSILLVSFVEGGSFAA
jgi:hypothetical protein